MEVAQDSVIVIGVFNFNVNMPLLILGDNQPSVSIVALVTFGDMISLVDPNDDKLPFEWVQAGGFQLDAIRYRLRPIEQQHR